MQKSIYCGMKHQDKETTGGGLGIQILFCKDSKAREKKKSFGCEE